MAEAERLLRTVLLVALLHSSPWAPPLSLSGLWGQDQQETRSALFRSTVQVEMHFTQVSHWTM